MVVIAWRQSNSSLHLHLYMALSSPCVCLLPDCLLLRRTPTYHWISLLPPAPTQIMTFIRLHLQGPCFHPQILDEHEVLGILFNPVC